MISYPKLIRSTEFYFWVILLLTFSLRFVNVSNLPVSLGGDEAAFGYEAFAILNQGSDEYGKKFPLYFQSIGDYKYPSYVYLTIPFVLFFGLNELSTRLLAVISGTISVIFVYLIIYKITGNRILSLFCQFVLALSSWHIFFSRGAFEATLGLMSALFAIFYYLSYLEKTRLKYLILTLVFFILSIFSYSVFRFILPGLILSVYLIFSPSKKDIQKTFNRGLLISLILVSFLSMLNQESRARVNSLIGGEVKILNVDRATLEIEDGLSNPGSVFWTRVFHNKVSELFFNLSGHFLETFSPDFLFINGDKTRQMYSIPNLGLLYLFEVLTIPLGLIYLVKNFPKLLIFLIIWLIIGVLPSTFVNESPSSVRLLVVSPVMAVLSGSGLYEMFRKIKNARRIFVIPGIFLIIISLLYNYLYGYHQYVNHFPLHRQWKTDFGMKEIVNKVNALGGNYKKVILSGDPYIFFLFYNKIKPDQFLKEASLSLGGVGKWERVNSIGKIMFKMPVDCPKVGKVNVLYVCRGVEIPQNSKLIDLIRYKDGIPAFSFIEFVPISDLSQKAQLPSNLHYMVELDKRNDGVIPENEDRYW